ncbi:hypothetical protein CYMTET_51697, partial [Cymbomonas tetramitiformis]
VGCKGCGAKARRGDGGYQELMVEFSDGQKQLEMLVACNMTSNLPKRQSQVKKETGQADVDGSHAPVRKGSMSGTDVKLQAKRWVTDLVVNGGWEVYRGYLDDELNTDNAWREARVVHMHCTTEQQQQLKTGPMNADGKSTGKIWTWNPICHAWTFSLQAGKLNLRSVLEEIQGRLEDIRLMQDCHDDEESYYVSLMTPRVFIQHAVLQLHHARQMLRRSLTRWWQFAKDEVNLPDVQRKASVEEQLAALVSPEDSQEKPAKPPVVGEVRFDMREKEVPWVRVPKDVGPHHLRKFLEHWQGVLGKAKVVLSVTGGAKDFQVSAELEAGIAQGLSRAARLARALIITGGLEAGVMRLVGQALVDDRAAEHLRHESFSSGIDKITPLGIASWGCVAAHQAMDAAACSNKTFDYPRNIQLRAQLERSIKKMFGIPVVCIAVEGGEGTLTTIMEALEGKIPVVVVNGSGRASNVVATTLEIMDHCREMGMETEDAHGGEHNSKNASCPVDGQAAEEGVRDRSNASKLTNDAYFMQECKKWVGQNPVEVLIEKLQSVYWQWKQDIPEVSERNIMQIQREVMAEFSTLVSQATDRCVVTGAGTAKCNGEYKFDHRSMDGTPIFVKKSPHRSVRTSGVTSLRDDTTDYQLYHRNGTWKLAELRDGRVLYQAAARDRQDEPMALVPHNTWTVAKMTTLRTLPKSPSLPSKSLTGLVGNQTSHRPGLVEQTRSMHHSEVDMDVAGQAVSPAPLVEHYRGLASALKLWDTLVKIAHPGRRPLLQVFCPTTEEPENSLDMSVLEVLQRVTEPRQRLKLAIEWNKPAEVRRILRRLPAPQMTGQRKWHTVAAVDPELIAEALEMDHGAALRELFEAQRNLKEQLAQVLALLQLDHRRHRKGRLSKVEIKLTRVKATPRRGFRALSPELLVFLWCVASGRCTAAWALWEHLPHALQGALLAAQLNRSEAERKGGAQSQTFRKSAEEYEKAALGMLDALMHPVDQSDVSQQQETLNVLKGFGLGAGNHVGQSDDLLELVLRGNALCKSHTKFIKRFVSHELSQMLLDAKWYGFEIYSPPTNILALMTISLFIGPWVLNLTMRKSANTARKNHDRWSNLFSAKSFDEPNFLTEEPDQPAPLGSSENRVIGWVTMHRSPWGKYIKYTIAQIVFLALATYVGVNHFAEFDGNSNSSSRSKAEITLVSWIAVSALEEVVIYIKQVPSRLTERLKAVAEAIRIARIGRLSTVPRRRRPAWHVGSQELLHKSRLLRFQLWRGMTDFLTTILALVTLALKMTTKSPQMAEWLRGAYACCIILFYIRFLRFLTAHHVIGPLLTSLITMIKDVVAWLIIALVTLPCSAFMVVMKQGAEGAAGPQHAGRYLVHRGLVLPLQRVRGPSHSVRPQPRVWSDPGLATCAPAAEADFRLNPTGWALFRLYTVFMSIMLLNLLIAMMASSYDAISSNVQNEFRFAFVKLLEEFEARYILPPPFSLLTMLWELFEVLWGMCFSPSSKARLWSEEMPPQEHESCALPAADFLRRRVQNAELKARSAYLQELKEEIARCSVHHKFRELGDEISKLQREVRNMKQSTLQQTLHVRSDIEQHLANSQYREENMYGMEDSQMHVGRKSEFMDIGSSARRRRQSLHF